MITHDVEEAIALADDIYVLGTQPMDIREIIRLSSPKPRSAAQEGFVAMRERIIESLAPAGASR